MHETVEKSIVLTRRRCHITSDEDGYDKSVDGDDTRHDDWDQRL